MPSSADTPRARALGAELRQAREDKGLSTRDLGKLIDRGSSHVSRWENGRLTPTEADTATVLAVLGIAGDERERLLELARDALDPNWVAPGVDKQLAALTEYERTARTIIDVEPLMIPGLMQTVDYARAMMIEFGASRGEADQRATHRVGRQHVLTDPHPAELVAIVGEHALRNTPCPAAVMDEQLRHLAKLAGLDNVTLLVLPSSTATAPALTGPWVLIEFDKAKPVLHLEHYSASATVTDPKTIARYKLAVDTLREVAMSPQESQGFIADVINERETTL